MDGGGKGLRQLPDKLKTCRHEEGGASRAAWHSEGHDGQTASRDRRKLDERWNFAPQRSALPIHPTAKVPAKETSAGPAALHENGGENGWWWEGASSTPGQVENLPPRRGRRFTETVGRMDGGGKGLRQLPDKLKTCRHERERTASRRHGRIAGCCALTHASRDCRAIAHGYDRGSRPPASGGSPC